MAGKERAFFGKTWGASRPAETAQVLYAFAATHAERDEKDRARALLASSMPTFDRAPLDLRVQAHGLLATVAASPTVAKEENAIVLALWADPRGAMTAIQSAWATEDDAKRDRRLARALVVVGRAMVGAADDKRVADVESLPFPTYVGKNDVASVQAFARDKAKEWYEKKRAAIERVEPLYVRVLEIPPFPPPASVIAAAGAVGKMWGDLADDLKKAPVADAWRRDKVLYKVYLDALASALQPLLDGRAKPAMKKCVELSVKYQYTSPASQACEAWLESHYPREYHRVEEIVPTLRPGPRSSPVAPLADREGGEAHADREVRRDPHGAAHVHVAEAIGAVVRASREIVRHERVTGLPASNVSAARTPSASWT